jgi:hypothetical protein
MNQWITRRFLVVAATHLGALVVGLGVSGVMVEMQSRAATSPWTDLGWAWALATNRAVCAADMGPWSRSVMAHRASLGEDDFAVEAAVALHLLTDQAGAAMSAPERVILGNAAERCPTVLNATCNGEWFDQAVQWRCRRMTDRHDRGRDGGTTHRGAGSDGE